MDKFKAKWKRMMSAYEKDRPASCIELARRYLAERPDGGPAWRILGLSLIEMSRYAEARKALGKSLALAPKSCRGLALADMGHLFEAKGSLKAAEEWHRKAARHRNDRHLTQVFLGVVLAKQGKLAEAKGAFRRAIKAAPKEADEAWYNLGGVLLAEERYAEAIECFDRAIELDPKYRIAKAARRDAVEAMKIAAKSGP